MDAVEEAVRVLRNEGIIVFPTETVYGIGGLVTSYHAVERVYRVKGRPAESPLTIHAAGIEQVLEYVHPPSEGFWVLAERLWPGPITIIVPASARTPRYVSAWMDKVGARIPDHPAFLDIVREVGAIVGPSANPSGRPSPCTVQQAMSYLGAHVDLYVDGGTCRYGIESTVVELLDGWKLRILRAGVVGAEKLRELGFEVEIAPEARGLKPGLGGYYRYTAEAIVVAVDPGSRMDVDVLASCIPAVARRLVELGWRIKLLLPYELARRLEELAEHVKSIGSLNDPYSVAKQLALALMESRRGEALVVPCFGEEGVWLALTARVRSASRGIIVDAQVCDSRALKLPRPS
jgi:L-threonylcarbamoyladenylate synthase